MRGLGLGSAVAGKVGYVAACLTAAVILVTAGYAHQVVGYAGSIAGGAQIGDSPSVGEMNILVMGLESRTNFFGQNLNAQQLEVTHSGNEAAVAAGREGSQDTDTLILVHIPAGGQKAVGFSIPRDDVVNYPHATYEGLTEGKIDAAYAYAYNQSLGQTVNESISSKQRYQLANDAGQEFEVQTVESVTGVHIDHFVESNIIGFYSVAQQLGGLEVCVKPAPAQGGLPAGANLTDKDPLTGTDNSGFNAYIDGYDRKLGGPQYLHLSAAQSLAFVRSRDTLPGIDIGRTARQQAAIDYVVWKLKNGGVLNDPGQISGLLSNANQYLEVDTGFNLLDFATDMKAFSGANLSFTTLISAPANNVRVPGYPGAQSVNFIYETKVQQLVNAAFYGSAATPPPASGVTVDVYNGSGTPGLAGQATQAFTALGYQKGKAADASAQSQPLQAGSQVFYGSGTEANANQIANDLGTAAAPLSSLPAGHVEVLLGSSVTALAPGLLAYGASTVTAQDYAGAAQADNLPAADLPPAATATPSAGTQSVGAALIGQRPSAAGARNVGAAPATLAVASGTPAGSDSAAVAANAKFGIPCVY